MTFIADLHIHSKYSRATSKNLDLENIYYTAQIKGVTVVGTGDFTFSAWVEQIESKLEETEPGFFSLKPEIARKIDETVPASCRNPVRFISGPPGFPCWVPNPGLTTLKNVLVI